MRPCSDKKQEKKHINVLGVVNKLIKNTILHQAPIQWVSLSQMSHLLSLLKGADLIIGLPY